MAPELYFISAILIVGFAALAWYLNHSLHKLQDNQKSDNTLTKWLQSMQGTLESSNKNITDTLLKSSRDLNFRLDKAAEVIGALQKEAGQFSAISASMRDLQAFLQSPKLRGNIGEQVLKDLISQVFPKQSFRLQHQFKNGTRVDAAITTDAGLLPIDSKFPMESFQAMAKAATKIEREKILKDFVKDVKKHIDDIAKKYILPEEGTLDFALMYLPSEPVYYEVVNDPSLTDYARRKRVYPVSPTTLYAHLQMILLSYEGKKIEASTREIFALMRAVQKDYDKVDSHLSILGSHLTNAFNKFSEVTGSFTLMGQKLTSSTRLESSDESLKLKS